MSYVSKVIKGTCPNCGKSKVFKTNGNPLLFKMPIMHKQCVKCGYHFHRETGFYFGAMYMSYALTVAEMVAVFVIGFWFEASFVDIFIVIVVAMFLLSTFNYRMSRLMWLNMFYEEEQEQEELN